MKSNALKKAFTLIELLVVIAIISLLASIIFASLTSARESARIAASMQFEGNLYRSLMHGGIWDFNNSSGSTVADASGNGSNMTLINSGFTWTSSSYHPLGRNYVSKTDGSNGYIRISKPIVLSGSFAISVWVKNVNVTSGGENAIIKTTGSVSSFTFEFNSGDIHARLDDGTALINSNASVISNDNKWHHVAVLYNDAKKRITIYYDGKQVSADSNPSMSSNFTIPIVVIGTDYDSVNDIINGPPFIRGNIDNLRIYTTAPESL